MALGVDEDGAGGGGVFSDLWYASRAASSAMPGTKGSRMALVGAGASVDTLQEALEHGIDTLIVGEGPHWTAVDADEMGIVIIYAGHYATETFGVKRLGEHLAERFALRHVFLDVPNPV